jgi:hypothetical protein
MSRRLGFRLRVAVPKGDAQKLEKGGDLKGPWAAFLASRASIAEDTVPGASEADLRLRHDCRQSSPVKPREAPKSIMCRIDLTNGGLG